jgi:cytochrome c5
VRRITAGRSSDALPYARQLRKSATVILVFFLSVRKRSFLLNALITTYRGALIMLKLKVAATLLVTILAAVTIATAAAKGNEAKGKYYFKQTCKQCHVKGAAGGEVTPLTKTMAQWRSFFEKGQHPRDKKPLTTVLPADQLADVQTFLVNHAADSLQPETCGK